MDRTRHAAPWQQLGIGSIDHGVHIRLAGNIALHAFDLKMLIVYNDHTQSLLFLPKNSSKGIILCRERLNSENC
jgi:hypothetical protein